MTTTAIAETSNRPGLIAQMAAKFKIEEGKLLPILKATAFRQKPNAEPVSNEQMAALLIVADQYGLNPFTKELFAYPDKGAIVPVVSVDGWIRIINDHEALDGIEFRYSDELAETEDAKPCPTWCEVIISRKDRSQPVVVREYLDEVYRPPILPANGGKIKGPWQSHTKRMLRHKTLIQGARIAFGFSGIYDEDEATRIIEAAPTETRTAGAGKGVEGLEARIRGARDVTPPASPPTQPEPAAEAGDPSGTPPAKDGTRSALTPTYAVIEELLRKAKDLDALDAAADLIAELPDEGQQAELGTLYHELRQKLAGPVQ